MVRPRYCDLIAPNVRGGRVIALCPNFTFFKRYFRNFCGFGFWRLSGRSAVAGSDWWPPAVELHDPLDVPWSSSAQGVVSRRAACISTESANVRFLIFRRF